MTPKEPPSPRATGPTIHLYYDQGRDEWIHSALCWCLLPRGTEGFPDEDAAYKWVVKEGKPK